jgi:hypothetical protein
MDVELVTPDLRRAADQLGVPPDAAPADARAAFLRRLPAAGFLPAAPLCAAAAELLGRPVPGAAGAEPPNDDALTAQVDLFTREFWSMEPPARRDRWRNLLTHAAADPLLAGRLRAMEAGVDLPESASRAATPRQRQLVSTIQALFVLGPIERAQRRREQLDGLPPPARAWEAAAREIARDFPAHAALEPALVERLSNWTKRTTADPRALSRPAATWGFQAQGGLQVPQARPVVERRPAERRMPVWLIIFLVISLLRLVTGLSSPSRDEPVYQPTYTPTPGIQEEKRRFLERWDSSPRRSAP